MLDPIEVLGASYQFEKLKFATRTKPFFTKINDQKLNLFEKYHGKGFPYTT